MTRRTAALLATATVAALCLAGCGDGDTDGSATDDGTSGASASATPSGSASATPGDDATATDGTDGASGSSTGATVAVPLYFLGETPQGPRLYREFRQVPIADPALEAAQAVVADSAVDPDYSSLLGSISVTGVEVGADAIVVTVEPTGTPAGELPRRVARTTVQALVYTLQGVAQSEAPVFLRTADGAPATVVGIDTTDGLRRAGELKVLALVNVTTPEQGAAVSGTFTAEGVASSFEGTVPWQVLDGSGTVVLDGFATAEGYIDGLYPWSTQVDVTGLAPGDYTFVARTDDPSEGEGGGPTEDTKAITVS